MLNALLVKLTWRFKFFAKADGNNDADKKKKLIFQHFGRALKEIPQCKRAKIKKNHHNYTLNAFRDKAEQLLWDFLARKNKNEAQYQCLCETRMPRNMKMADYTNQVQVINERLRLIDRAVEKLRKR